MKTKTVVVWLFLGLFLTSCASNAIVAGEDATVVGVRYRSAGETRGWQLFLVTEECPSGTEIKEGPGINEGCELIRHRTNPRVYRNFEVGERIVWEGDTQASEVEERRYRRTSSGNSYKLLLLVEQCLGASGNGMVCVQNTVSVNLDTWRRYERGDTIVFSGEYGDIVS